MIYYKGNILECDEIAKYINIGSHFGADNWYFSPLIQNRIKGLILDIDNTLIDYDKKLLPDADKWCNNLKQK